MAKFVSMRKTIYFIAPYPQGEAPSQRFRFEQYLPYLKESGFDVEVIPFVSLNTWRLLYKEGQIFRKIVGILGSFSRRWLLLFRLRKADHLFIHREMAQLGPPVFEWVLSKVMRRKYIYDFDDAIWLPNYSESNARFHRLKAYWKVNYCMKWASVVTAGNDYLANYARQYNQTVEVIPTTIDMDRYHSQTTNYDQTPLIIGWTGSHTTMHYLNEIVPVIARLEKKYDFEFHVISNQAPDFHLNSLHFVQWAKETEIADLVKFSIGLMPLTEDQWSGGKCGFKALQYMALGIPTVLSPVGVNTTIVNRPEVGFLVSTPEEWETALEQLLNDPQLRRTIGQNGQTQVRQHYSVRANSEKYLKLFKS